MSLHPPNVSERVMHSSYIVCAAFHTTDIWVIPSLDIFDTNKKNVLLCSELLRIIY